MSRSQAKMGGNSIESRKAFLWERTQSVSKTGGSGWSCKESETGWWEMRTKKQARMDDVGPQRQW